MIYDTAAVVYWAAALVIAYAVIAVFYVRRARARGVGTAVAPYIGAGVVIALVITGIAVWRVHDPLAIRWDFAGVDMRPGSGAEAFFDRISGPAGAIGLALLVLSWVERNAALGLFTGVYLVVVALPFHVGGRPSPWAFLPHLAAEAGLLLAGGLVFAVVQRRRPGVTS